MSSQTFSVQRPYKLGIVGAGQVGSAIAYASMIRRSARIISLYDINAKVADAQVADLSHGTMFTESKIMGGGDLDVLADSHVIIFTAGASQKPGQSRLDLASINAGIIADTLPKILEIAPDAIVIVVTNPADVMTVVAQKVSGLPKNRVFSTGTLLDTSRLRYLIGEHINVSQTSVHATVVGEHGDSEFVLWDTAQIAGIPLTEWEVDGKKAFTEEVMNEIATTVQTAAYRVIEGKGSTNYAIGLTSASVVEALFADKNQVMPVSGLLEDYYGVSDVALSVPCLVGREGLEKQLLVPMSDHEKTLLKESAAQIRKTLDGIGY